MIWLEIVDDECPFCVWTGPHQHSIKPDGSLGVIVEPLHADRSDGWCRHCGCAYPCPGSVVQAPVEPVSLTRGGFMLGR